MAAAVPVPSRTTPCSAYVTRLASFCAITCSPGVAIDGSISPSSNCTWSSGVAQCRSPLSAIVPYALVISSGLTATEPSVTAHTSGSFERIPSVCAMSTTVEGPSCAMTCAKIVLTECAVAPASVKSPASPSPALTGCQMPSGCVESGQSGMPIVAGPCQYALRS